MDIAKLERERTVAQERLRRARSLILEGPAGGPCSICQDTGIVQSQGRIDGAGGFKAADWKSAERVG